MFVADQFTLYDISPLSRFYDYAVQICIKMSTKFHSFLSITMHLLPNHNKPATMYAFAPPTSIKAHPLRLNHSKATCPLPRRTSPRPGYKATADTPDHGPAVNSGENLRKELRILSENRQAQAKRTEDALNDMSNELAKISAKLRRDAGMPPVAEPPSTVSSSSTPPKPSPALVSDAEEDASSASDEPYMDPSNFGYDSTAGWQVLAATDELPVTEGGKVQFRIECDMNGCSLIEIRGDAPPGPGVRQRFIQSGAGFRVGYDPEAPKGFCGMVGNEQWLLALNYDEIRHFKRLCLSLQKRMDRIGRGEEDPPMKKPALRRSGDGMYNMRVARAGLDCSVELESKLLWVQAIGQPVSGQYCIRAIFMESRQSEGFWGPETVPNLLAALNKLGVD